MSVIFRTILALLLGTAVASGSASRAAADCNPIDFMVRDVNNLRISDRVLIAFLLSATKEQYDSASNAFGSGLAFGLISGKLNFDQARTSAMKEAALTKFDYQRDYYLNYLSQQLPPTAAKMHFDCLTLDKTTPGLRIWFGRKEGDYVFLNAFWVGDDPRQAVGKLVGAPVVRDAELVEKLPDEWIRGGEPVQIVLKKSSTADAYIGLNVDGKRKSFVVVRDVAPVAMATQVVIGARKMSARSNNQTSTICPAGTDRDCVMPQKPGGYLVVGSGDVTDFQRSDSTTVNWQVVTDKPEQICIEITARTGACEVTQTGSGRATAVERYPVNP